MGFKRTICITVFVLEAFFAFQTSAQTGNDYWVIGNNIGNSKITRKQLKDAFTAGITKWKNGNNAVVVFHDSKSEECQRTADLFFQGSILALQKYWLSIVFQGRANNPQFFNNHKEVVDFVTKNEGSIAIVYSPEDIEGLQIVVQ